MKINKVFDLSSISVLPPRTRKSNTVSRGLQVPELRSKPSGPSQQSSSHGLSSQNALLSQFSQNYLDEAVATDQDVSEESQPPSSPLSSLSHSYTTKKIEELESGTEMAVGSSPVSVLDTPFLEDDISHESTRFQLGKNQEQPLQIQFEEHESFHMDQIDNEKQFVEENKLIFDYIKAILHASGFNRDQLWIRCVSSDQILLDPSLSDQVEVYSNQLCRDEKMLYDRLNEVLTEVCSYYFGDSPSNTRPTPNLKTVILEVLEGVCWHLLPLSPSHTLDQIIDKDMARSGAWMDLRSDAEQVGFEISEAILAELMEDTILSCVMKHKENDVRKVWEEVCWYLLPLSPSHDLDQLVKKDIGRSGAWMDLQFDVQQVGFELDEAILAELIEDTILSCVSESLESKCSEIQGEMKGPPNFNLWEQHTHAYTHLCTHT